MEKVKYILHILGLILKTILTVPSTIILSTLVLPVLTLCGPAVVSTSRQGL